MTVSTTFDNKAGPDFSRIFEEAPVLKDTLATRDRLKDYALHLQDLMAAKDTMALMEEFGSAIDGRFRIGSPLSRSEFFERNREAIVLKDVTVDFSRADLRLRPWSEGRGWQIWRREGVNQALFQRPSGSSLGKTYVAEIDGALKVVR